jgi:hypothetical protein
LTLFIPDLQRRNLSGDGAPGWPDGSRQRHVMLGLKVTKLSKKVRIRLVFIFGNWLDAPNRPATLCFEQVQNARMCRAGCHGSNAPWHGCEDHGPALRRMFRPAEK